MPIRSKYFAFVLLAVAAGLALFGGAVWQQFARAVAIDVADKLARAVQTAHVVFKAEESRLVAISRELAARDTVQYASNIDDSNALKRLLDSLTVVEQQMFHAVIAPSGAVLAASGELPANFPEIAHQLTLPSYGTARHIAVPVGVAGDVLLLGLAPLRQIEQTNWVVSGVSLREAILPAIARAGGLRVTLGSAKPDGATVMREMVLTTSTGAGVAVTLSQADLDAAPRALLLAKIVVFGLAVIVLIGAAIATLFGIFLRRAVEQPVERLVDALTRIQQEVYTKPVRLSGLRSLQNLATGFNEMQLSLSERESQIDEHSQYDSLTGLTSRSAVDDKLTLAVAKARNSGATVAALALDISRFKEINGTHGQEVGDEVLKEIARRLVGSTRVTDTVARVGGDEFMIILEETDDRLALHLAEFLASSIETPIDVHGEKVQLKVRLGLALFPRHCDSAPALRRMSNIALFAGKEQDTRVMLYEPGQDEKQLREIAIVHDLPSAIDNNELYLQYQPKIDVETQRVGQVEALVRWRHPQLGFIPPDEFVGLIEQSGKTAMLTQWVFRTAIAQCRDWLALGYRLGIAVNISAQDLVDEQLPERVEGLLRHYLVDPSLISVEITESAVMRNPERACEILKHFKDIGVKIALDDFGTGQTSLAMLKQMPLSELKIDKSFVQNLRADSGDAIIVKSTIDLGHNMGLLVVAEGVESNYCWNLLNSYGCDLVQGYLVSAPLTADELAEWYVRLQNRHVNKLDLSFMARHTA